MATVEELKARALESYVSPYDLAICHAGLADIDVALDYLEEAYAQRVMRIISIGDPELDAFRLTPGSLLC